MSGHVSITIPNDQWIKADGKKHLIATVIINGCHMHLEAIKSRKGKCADISPEWISNAITESAEGEDVLTAIINGDRYVLIATPYTD